MRPVASARTRVLVLSALVTALVAPARGGAQNGSLLPIAARPFAILRNPAAAPFESLILPGSGQLVLHQDRAVAYAAVELAYWLEYAKDRNEQAVQESYFRDLARRIARVNFMTPANLPDGDWPYYELLRSNIESGVYSLGDTVHVIPETDPATYNGRLWAQIQERSATRDVALADYESRAVHPDYQWSWRNAQLQKDLYSYSTDQRNRASQSRSNDLVVLSVNHLLSFVDAFTTVRLRLRSTSDGGYELRGSFVVR